MALPWEMDWAAAASAPPAVAPWEQDWSTPDEDAVPPAAPAADMGRPTAESGPGWMDARFGQGQITDRAQPVAAPVEAAPAAPAGDSALIDLQAGIEQAGQIVPGLGVAGGIATVRRGTDIAEGGRLAEDLGFTISPADRADMETRQAALMDRGVDRIIGSLPAILESNARIADMPTNPAAAKAMQADSIGAALSATSEDVWGVARTFALRSLPASAPTILAAIAGSALGGPAGAGAAAGSVSMSTEAALSVANVMEPAIKQAGVDPNDPAAVAALIRQDPGAFKEILRDATIRAGIIGAADAATGGVTGALGRWAAAGGRARIAGGAVAGSGVEAAGEGAGEALAGGSPGDVLAEAIGGATMGAPTTAAQTAVEMFKGAPANPQVPDPRLPVTRDQIESPIPTQLLQQGTEIIRRATTGEPLPALPAVDKVEAPKAEKAETAAAVEAPPWQMDWSAPVDPAADVADTPASPSLRQPASISDADMNTEDTAILAAAGYGAEDIADMSPAERAAEAAQARAQGVVAPPRAPEVPDQAGGSREEVQAEGPEEVKAGIATEATDDELEAINNRILHVGFTRNGSSDRDKVAWQIATGMVRLADMTHLRGGKWEPLSAEQRKYLDDNVPAQPRSAPQAPAPVAPAPSPSEAASASVAPAQPPRAKTSAEAATPVSKRKKAEPDPVPATEKPAASAKPDPAAEAAERRAINQRMRDLDAEDKRATALRQSVTPLASIKGGTARAMIVDWDVRGAFDAGGYVGNGHIFLKKGTVKKFDEAAAGHKQFDRDGIGSSLERMIAAARKDQVEIEWRFATRTNEARRGYPDKWKQGAVIGKAGDKWVGVDGRALDFLNRNNLELRATADEAMAAIVNRDGETVGALALMRPGTDVELQDAIAREAKPAPAEARTRATPAFQRKAQAVAADLQARVDRMKLPGVRVGVADRMFAPDGTEIDGLMDPVRGLIAVAINGSRDPSVTFGHEALHALKAAGLFRDAEWRALEAAARADTKRMQRAREEYPDLDEAGQVEEVIADLYGEWAAGRIDAKGFVRTAFEKIKAFITALRQSLKGEGFASADAIFGAIDRGDVGGRRSGSAVATATKQARSRTDTPEFKRWFGDSKVVDESGEPLVVYHGSAVSLSKDRKGIEAFDPAMLGAYTGADSASHGFFFSSSPTVADSYNKRAMERAPLGGPQKRVDDAERNLAMWEEGAATVEPYFDDDEDGWMFRTTEYDDFGSEFDYTSDLVYGDEAEAAEAAQAFADAETEKARKLLEKRQAELEASSRDLTLRTGPTVYPVYLSIQNPLVHDFKGGNYEDQSFTELMEEAKEEGHDGVLMKRVRDAHPLGDDPSEVSDVWVAFEPTQIKSVFNAGTFDPADPRIRYRRSSAPSLPEETNRQLVWRKIKDDKGRLLQAQRFVAETSGAPIPEHLDAYLAAGLFQTKSAAQLRAYHEGPVAALNDALKKALKSTGAKAADVDAWLIAKHAPARNRVMADRGVTDGSGMSDADAALVVADAQAKGWEPEFENVAQHVYAMLKADVDRRVQSGLISQEEADAWAAMYPDGRYVPLRGWAERADDDPDPQSGAMRTGRGFDVRGPESRRAKGRSSQADSPLAYAVMMGAEGIVRVGKNQVAKTLYRFAKEYPTSVVEAIGKKPVRSALDLKTGEDALVIDQAALQAANIMAAKIGGKPYYVRLSPELAVGFKNLGVEQLNGITRVMRKFTRYWSSMLTGRNPAFFIPNATVDAMTGLLTAMSNDAPKGFARRYLTNYLYAMSTLWQFNAGIPLTAKQQAMIDEWHADGGRMDLYGYQNLDDIKAEIEGGTDASRAGRAKRLAKQAIPKTLSAVEWLNFPFENAARFASYLAARKSGVSRARAAMHSLESTGNFMRRGEMTPLIGAWYPFFNASMTGIEQLGRYASKRKTQAVLAGAVMFPAIWALSIASSYPGDDDPEGIPLYFRIPDWERSRSLIIPRGVKTVEVKNADGTIREVQRLEYATVRIPHALRPFWTLGDQFAALYSGVSSVGDVVTKTFASTLFNWNPVSGSDPVAMALPLVGDPVYELSRNKDGLGRTIRPAGFGEEEKGVRAYSWQTGETSPWAIAAAREMNTLTGGDAVTPGWVSVHPDHLEYLWEFMVGGLGRFVSETAQTAANMAEGVETPPNKRPIIRTAIGETDASVQTSAFYDMLGEGEELAARMNNVKKRVNQGQLGEAEWQEAVELADHLGAKLSRDEDTDWGDSWVSVLRKARNATNKIRDEEIAVTMTREDISRAEIEALVKDMRGRQEAIRLEARTRALEMKAARPSL